MIHRRAFTLLGLFALVGLATAPASAQPASGVEVRVGETVSFTLPRLVQIIDTEDHAVATMIVTPDGHVRVTGVSEGRTRIVGRDLAQLPIIYPVTVTPARP